MGNWGDISWPISMFLSILSVCIVSLRMVKMYFQYKKTRKEAELVHEKDMKLQEREYDQNREERLHGWACEKTKENQEKEIESLKKQLEQSRKGEALLDVDRIAFLMYVLSNKKDVSLDMEKLSKEIESFKSIYKDFEKYLKTNQ